MLSMLGLGVKDLVRVHTGSLSRRIVVPVIRALWAVLVGLLILVGGLVLRRSPEAATQTVAEVLSFGGVVIAVIGAWQLVARFVESRDN